MQENEEMRGSCPGLGFQLGLEKWIEFLGKGRAGESRKGEQRPEHVFHTNEILC